MFNDASRVFDLLSNATLPPGEGDRLIAALKRATAQPTPPPATPVNVVRVDIEGPNGNGSRSTNVSVGLVHTGLRIASMLPGGGAQKIAAKLRAHGVDVDPASLTREQLETLLADVREVTIHVPAEQTRVHLTVE